MSITHYQLRRTTLGSVFAGGGEGGHGDVFGGDFTGEGFHPHDHRGHLGVRQLFAELVGAHELHRLLEGVDGAGVFAAPASAEK